jgi:hypothetical protein
MSTKLSQAVAIRGEERINTQMDFFLQGMSDMLHNTSAKSKGLQTLFARRSNNNCTAISLAHLIAAKFSDYKETTTYQTIVLVTVWPWKTRSHLIVKLED